MFKRKLNELEYLVWTFGQPNNICMSVTMKGNLDIQRLRNSLDLLQKKHAMLKAQIFVGENNLPYFIWNDIEKIPLEIIKRTRDDFYKDVVEKEFLIPFEFGKEIKKPLIRAKVLVSESEFDLILTIQHSVGDGISMAYLFRDILRFYIKPKKEIKEQEGPKYAENIIPSYYQKKIPKTSIRFKIYSWILRVYLKFSKFKSKILGKYNTQKYQKIDKFDEKHFLTEVFILSREETKKIINNCKKHKVTIHSAISTMFLGDFNSINNPINLRDRLEYKVKDSVGLFASGIIINMKYKGKLSFWENVKKYHKNLTKKRNSNDPFKIFRIVSRAVPLEDIEKFGTVFLELESSGKPFAITNLGSLDKMKLLSKSNDLEVDYIFGGVSSSFNAIILTVFTIQRKMHWHLHYYNPPYSKKEIRNYLQNAVKKLQIALND